MAVTLVYPHTQGAWRALRLPTQHAVHAGGEHYRPSAADFFPGPEPPAPPPPPPKPLWSLDFDPPLKTAGKAKKAAPNAPHDVATLGKVSTGGEADGKVRRATKSRDRPPGLETPSYRSFFQPAESEPTSPYVTRSRGTSASGKTSQPQSAGQTSEETTPNVSPTPTKRDATTTGRFTVSPATARRGSEEGARQLGLEMSGSTFVAMSDEKPSVSILLVSAFVPQEAWLLSSVIAS